MINRNLQVTDWSYNNFRRKGRQVKSCIGMVAFNLHDINRQAVGDEFENILLFYQSRTSDKGDLYPL